MIDHHLYSGKLVRLSVEDPQGMAEAFAAWGRDDEYLRLLDSSPSAPVSIKKLVQWNEKDLDKDPPAEYCFMVRRMEDDRLIGMVCLDGLSRPHGDTFVGIGIGERELWGKGYGTEAMELILGYAFRELNLRRVSLNVFEYNARAIRSYEKTGFVQEGRVRQYLQRGGKRWDLIYMGILREAWQAAQAQD